jgi:hypothetical protein
MRRCLGILATSALVIVALPAVAHAHVSIRSFDLSPGCVTPGSPVNWRVAVRQDHLHHVHPVWGRVVVRHSQTGAVVYQRDEGPRWVPFGDYEESRTEVVPANTPAGDYVVSLLLGSTAGGSDWGTASRPLKVRLVPALCSV